MKKIYEKEERITKFLKTLEYEYPTMAHGDTFTAKP